MTIGLKSLAVAALVVLGSASYAATVTFTINPGTHENAWNTPEAPIQLKVGDTFHIVNNDDVEHAIHTGGTPFSHTGFIKPGQSYDAKVTGTWDFVKQHVLYDHFYQEKGFVYLNVTE